jgi:hypothetical protein
MRYGAYRTARSRQGGTRSGTPLERATDAAGQEQAEAGREVPCRVRGKHGQLAVQQKCTATLPNNMDLMRPAQASDLHQRPASTSTRSRADPARRVVPVPAGRAVGADHRSGPRCSRRGRDWTLSPRGWLVPMSWTRVMFWLHPVFRRLDLGVYARVDL